MCGIAGILDPTSSTQAPLLQEYVERMANVIRHRGPDDSGTWVDARQGVAFSHRRLAIIDPEPSGHQPMISRSGRYVLSYNGEVYNFQVLRKALHDYVYRGHSDTEVMLAAIERWGVRGALDRFAGMFAFSLWDREKNTLLLARDRVGIKPLYYGTIGNLFLFGSELKSLRAHPRWSGEIDRSATALFLRHNYIPAPYSIYRGVHKLLPGTALTVSGAGGSLELSCEAFWSARSVAERGALHADAGDESGAADRFETLLREVVVQHMQSDVPLGAFLSGGVDSSLVVAMMRANSEGSIETFTVGFRESDHNEAPHALRVARHLGTKHTELYVSARDAMSVIPRLPQIYDEPFSDSSQIPTFLISQLIRKHVTVALSGDGGDELFGGYPRYRVAQRLWRSFGWVPSSVRKAAGEILCRTTVRGRIFDKCRSLGDLLCQKSQEELYHRLLSQWRGPTSVVLGAEESPTALTDSSRWAELPSFAEKMMFLDFVSYLPDDILVKVDRASMATSLETRVPILDHRIVEFALGLPLQMRMAGPQGKRLLRRVLYRHVPREFFDREKKGFSVPLGVWLRGPLRDWAEGLLSERKLREEGVFVAQAIRSKWTQHLEHGGGGQSLWNVLMFQAWMDANRCPVETYSP